MYFRVRLIQRYVQRHLLTGVNNSSINIVLRRHSDLDLQDESIKFAACQRLGCRGLFIVSEVSQR